jgi:hypothetical protein
LSLSISSTIKLVSLERIFFKTLGLLASKYLTVLSSPALAKLAYKAV